MNIRVCSVVEMHVRPVNLPKESARKRMFGLTGVRYSFRLIHHVFIGLCEFLFFSNLIMLLFEAVTGHALAEVHSLRLPGVVFCGAMLILALSFEPYHPKAFFHSADS